MLHKGALSLSPVGELLPSQYIYSRYKARRSLDTAQGGAFLFLVGNVFVGGRMRLPGWLGLRKEGAGGGLDGLCLSCPGNDISFVLQGDGRAGPGMKITLMLVRCSE